MTHGELIENLGTIAHSGSKAFLEQLKASKGDAQSHRAVRRRLLLGLHGRGKGHRLHALVSARRDGLDLDERRHARGYEIEPASDLARGTKIVLHLQGRRSSRRRRASSAIIKHYSNFVPFPIELNGNAVNTVQALWTKNKSEITDEEYKEFYKYVGARHRAAAVPAALLRRRAALHPRAALRAAEKLRAAHA